MVNISIVSACNNNCDYCFQKDSYHRINKILEYDEIEYILNWSHGTSRIGILGGEPTLHPEIVRIVQRAAQDYPVSLFTNLLCDTKTLIDITNVARFGCLVNTTTRDELKDLFEENIKYLSKLNQFNCALGITLVGDLEYDMKHILNLVRLGKTYSAICKRYRIALATPCHDKVFKLKYYDESVLKFYEISKKETPNIQISFDCAINHCLLSKNCYNTVMQDNRTMNVSFGCNRQSDIDIMSDRSINYCGSVPDEIFKIRDYRQFSNWQECSDYINKIRHEFMEKHNLFCKEVTNCKNKYCPGACFASMVNLVKQEEKKPKIIREINKRLHKFNSPK